jgi:serine/threonine protein phosphatase PrpC
MIIPLLLRSGGAGSGIGWGLARAKERRDGSGPESGKTRVLERRRLMAQFWYSSARGRRPAMEDSHFTAECPVSKWIMFAVCDGHGGTGVVRYLEKTLTERVLSALGRASRDNAASVMPMPMPLPPHARNPYTVPVRPSYLRQCMRLLVIALDSEMERELKTPEARGSGSTLIMMAYQPLTRQIALVNVGDSRAVLALPAPLPRTRISQTPHALNPPAGGSGAVVVAPGAATVGGAGAAVEPGVGVGVGVGGVGAVAPVGFARVDGAPKRLIETKDHKPGDKDELLRVTAAGSFVSKNRVGGILALSRAMGDYSLKKSLRLPYDPVSGAVCALPDVQVGYISPVSFATAVLACDGIWDVLSSQEAVEIAELALQSGENPADKLVHVAFQKLSSDNLTCLVVRLHPAFYPRTPHPPIQTHTHSLTMPR